MNWFTFILLIITIQFIEKSKSANERNTIETVFNREGGVQSFSKIETWRQELKKSIFESLSKLPTKAKQGLIEKADKDNKRDWVSFRASEYLQYVETGDRYNFETSNTNRRVQLVNLVVGELLTQNGTYIRQIADGLWLIFEESTWVTPGHIYIQKAGNGLPDPDEQVIDLRAGEVSVTMSYIRLLLGDSLAKVNKMFLKRLDYELHRRIVEPYLTNDDMWWLGFDPKHTVNNWNSWVNANMLKTALIAIDDPTLRNAMIARSVKSIDKFVNVYPEDGGCDEGPGYWEYAGGELIEYMDFITSASYGRINFTDYELFKKIGSYIYKIHIDGNRFVNFADAHGVLLPESARVFKFGSLFDDINMKQFAAYINKFKDDGQNLAIITASDELGSFSTFISQLLAYSTLLSLEAKAPQLKHVWFPDLQVVAMRSQEGTAKGLFFAAKGGHNDESHNHNDIGNFVVYVDGKPALIDIGVGQYTNETFSNDRYSLWSMQSQWHNCPTINGVQQKNGKQYKASNVVYSPNEAGGEFSEDIAGAYPSTAAVKSWLRKWQFNGTNNTLKMIESFQLTSWKEPFNLHFITMINATYVKNGEIQLKYKEGPGLLIQFDYNKFDVKTDEVPITDAFFLEAWGKTVWRITLVAKAKNQLNDNFEIDFKLIN